MKRVIVIDTTMLCVWLGVPGKSTCGTRGNQWDKGRVERYLKEQCEAKATLVLPLATILETGNHIARADELRFETASALGQVMSDAADERSPWAAFTEQSSLWDADNLKRLAAEWPRLATSKFSIGDATIKQVAEYYAKAGYEVEILTGDEGLKAYQPSAPVPIPRRRRG